VRPAGRIAICIAAVALAGAPSIPAAVTPKVVPRALVGCWARDAELPAGYPSGTWRVSIKRSGKLVAYNPAVTSCGTVQDFSGSVSITGRHLTVGPLPACPASGTYTWGLVGGSLTLEKVKDACAARVALLAGVWKRA